jgi:hypothetical protein
MLMPPRPHLRLLQAYLTPLPLLRPQMMESQSVPERRSGTLDLVMSGVSAVTMSCNNG